MAEGEGSIFPKSFEATRRMPNPGPGQEQWDVRFAKTRETVRISDNPMLAVEAAAIAIDEAYKVKNDPEAKNAYLGPAVAALGKERRLWNGVLGAAGLAPGANAVEQTQNASKNWRAVVAAGEVPETSRMLGAAPADLQAAIAALRAYYLGGPAPALTPVGVEIDNRARAMYGQLQGILPGGVPPQMTRLVCGLALDQATAVLKRMQAGSEGEFKAQAAREVDYPWRLVGGKPIPPSEFRPNSVEQHRIEYERAVEDFREAAEQKSRWGPTYLTKAYYKSEGRLIEEKPSRLNEISMESMEAVYQEPGGRQLLEEFAAYVVLYRPVRDNAGHVLMPLQHAGNRFNELRQIVAEQTIGHLANTPKGKVLIETVWNELFVGHLGESAQTREDAPLNDAKLERPAGAAADPALLEVIRIPGDWPVTVTRDATGKVISSKINFPPDPLRPPNEDPAQLLLPTGELPFINQRSADVALGGDLWRLMHPLEGVLAMMRGGESWGSVADWVKAMLNKSRRKAAAAQLKETYPKRLGKSFFEATDVTADNGRGGQEKMPMLQALLLKRTIDFDKSFGIKTKPFGWYMTQKLGPLRAVFNIFSGGTKFEFMGKSVDITTMEETVGEALRSASMDDDQDLRDSCARVLAIDVNSPVLGIPTGGNPVTQGLSAVESFFGVGLAEGSKGVRAKGQKGRGFFSEKAFRPYGS